MRLPHDSRASCSILSADMSSRWCASEREKEKKTKDRGYEDARYIGESESMRTRIYVIYTG
jgi:hypothetical protein